MTGLLSSTSVPHPLLGFSLDEWRKLVGQNIKRLARLNEKPLKGLAAHLKISPQQLSKYTSGRQLPAKYLDKIRDYFGCEYKDLFETDPLAGKRPSSVDEALRILAEDLGYSVVLKGQEDA